MHGVPGRGRGRIRGLPAGDGQPRSWGHGMKEWHDRAVFVAIVLAALLLLILCGQALLVLACDFDRFVYLLKLRGHL